MLTKITFFSFIVLPLLNLEWKWEVLHPSPSIEYPPTIPVWLWCLILLQNYKKFCRRIHIWCTYLTRTDWILCDSVCYHLALVHSWFCGWGHDALAYAMFYASCNDAANWKWCCYLYNYPTVVIKKTRNANSPLHLYLMYYQTTSLLLICLTQRSVESPHGTMNIPTHLLTGPPLCGEPPTEYVPSCAPELTFWPAQDSRFIALTRLKLDSAQLSLSENRKLLRWPFPVSLRESSNWFFLLLSAEANKNLHLCTDMPQFHKKHKKTQLKVKYYIVSCSLLIHVMSRR